MVPTDRSTSSSAKSPPPESADTAEAERLARVAAALRGLIAAEGPVPFDFFMETALYLPGDGYYSGGRGRTGRGGDFITNVSTGPVFGRLLARHAADVWEALDRPAAFDLVEQGAADGQLMADLLAALARDHPACLAAVRPWIVEPHPELRKAQESTLRALPAGPLRHVADPADLPPLRGLFYCNELPDAFPVRLFVRRHESWWERRVAAENDGFVFQEVPVGETGLRRRLEALPLPAGGEPFHLELSLGTGPWIHRVAGRLQAGSVLICDYGFTEQERLEPRRAGGTLAAVRGHRRIDDPLANPGAQDLTSHVDFTHLAREARAAGLTIAGYGDQHHVLAALAARVFPGEAGSTQTTAELREFRALRLLLHPETMGRAFRFLALARPPLPELPAFAFSRRDLATLEPPAP